MASENEDIFSGLDLAPKQSADDGADVFSGLDLTSDQSAAQAPKSEDPSIATTRLPQPGEPEKTWGEALTSAGKELLPSAGRVIKGTAEAVIHPVESVEALGAIGKGILSKAEGAVGVSQDQEQKSSDEAVLNALMDVYKTTYGTTKGFKEAIAKDPASVLMDLSLPLTLLPSGGATATGPIARALNIAREAGRLMNPVEDAIRIAKPLASVAGATMRGAQSVSTGVPYKLLKLASEAGSTADPEKQAIFTRFASGEGDDEEIFQSAKNAFEQARNKASEDFSVTKAGQAATANPPSYQPIIDEIQKRRQELQLAGARDPVGFKSANDALDKISGIVARHMETPGAQNYLEFDKLKRAIWDLPEGHSTNVAYQTMGGVYHSVKKALSDAAPEYEELMDQWDAARTRMQTLQKGLGIGPNASAPNALAKMMNSFKTKDGSNLIQNLSKYDDKLPYMLAGSAVNPWTRGDIIGQLTRYGGLPAVLMHPALLPHAAAGMAGLSPRVAGMTNYYLSRGSSLAGRAALPAEYAAYAASMAQNPMPTDVKSPEEAQSMIGNIKNLIEKAESGGNQFDKDGNPLTSKKGAVGAMQMTDAAGKDAAQYLGEKYDPNRMRMDEAYNRRLGHAYYDLLLNSFGDPGLAVAAYNAGPSRLKNAIDKMRKEGGSWLDYMPQETQDYFRKIMGKPVAAHGGRITRATGGRTGMDHVAKAVALVKMAERAKKMHSNHTEQLLDVPDESIAAALKVANRAI